MNSLEEAAYCAVRTSTGPQGDREWLDVSSVADTPVGVRRKVKESDDRAPVWASKNPSVRVVQVKITAVEE